MSGKLLTLTLPSDYDQMESLIKLNKIKLMEHIVTSIGYALNSNLDVIEIFNFENSDFIVVIDYESFEFNLDNIYDYYISTEIYEKCSRVLEIKQQINKKNDQEKRYKSKGLSKRKN